MENSTKYKIFLFFIFFIFWLWAAKNPLYYDDWLIENYLVFIFVPLLIIMGTYFKLSDLSYTLITIFMILHVIGSHYTYSEVPFGYILQDWLSASRNMYDRLVHFSFGLLLAYPIREIFLRLAKVRGFWGYYLPLDLTLSFSALYEIIEWSAAISVDPNAGVAFLGTQGDVWDAQKDMLLAGMGAFTTMLITAIINLIYNKNFWIEMKESFRKDKNDGPLGEVKLKKFFHKNNLTKHI